MIYAVYDKDTGEIYRTLDMPEFMLELTELNDNELIIEVEREPNDETEIIYNGQIVLKPTA